MTMRGLKAIVVPPVLLLGVWVGVLILLIVGPIDYPGQPSLAALVAIAVGMLTFTAGHLGGAWLPRLRLGSRLAVREPSRRPLERAMIITAVLGIVGILFIALDREVLSGISNTDYATALRCAPEFIDAIEIRRTPFIYIGYQTFSFGFVSLALYLLQAEEVGGWPSYLAQASIVSPIGYGLLYSGRMPILMMLMLLLSVGLVRVCRGRPPLPRGHYLLAKAAFLAVVFAVYVNMMWSSRQNYCAQMGSVVLQLRETLAARAKEQALAREASQAAPTDTGATRPPAAGSTADESTSKISAEVFANQIRERMDQASAQASKTEQDPNKRSGSAAGAGGKLIFAIMRQEWGVEPRSYVVAAADWGSIPPSSIIGVMSNYFYVTHGVMTLDRLLQAHDRLQPVWGIYEIGVLSPIVRVFFPHSGVLKRMNEQLRESRTYGFFPTVWGAAIFDFGIPGAITYIFLWGTLGGWGYALSRRTTFLTPTMALTFVLMSVLLSPLQGPLGIANSALVLFSMLATGLSVDLGGLFDRPSPLLVPSSPGE
jgi:hypothetical protein